MKASTFRLPDLTQRSFAHTNTQTIAQRVVLLRELVPGAQMIAEICCGDCSRQTKAYTRDLGISTFRGLIHYSYSALIGNNEVTELRLKYVELWFSSRLENLWEARNSGDKR